MLMFKVTHSFFKSKNLFVCPNHILSEYIWKSQWNDVRFSVPPNLKTRLWRNVPECRFLAGFISDGQMASVYLGGRRFPFMTHLWYVPILETDFHREHSWNKEHWAGTVFSKRRVQKFANAITCFSVAKQHFLNRSESMTRKEKAPPFFLCRNEMLKIDAN